MKLITETARRAIKLQLKSENLRKWAELFVRAKRLSQSLHTSALSFAYIRGVVAEVIFNILFPNFFFLYFLSLVLHFCSVGAKSFPKFVECLEAGKGGMLVWSIKWFSIVLSE